MPNFPLPSPARTLLRPVVVAAAAGLVSGVLLWLVLALGAGGPGAGPVHEGGWVNRERAWFSHRGFHGTEFSQEDDRPYNWTSGSVRLQIPNLDRSQPHDLVFEVDAPRPSDIGPARLAWTVDGVSAGERVLAGGPETVVLHLPADRRTRAVITMTIGPTFAPGAEDARDLGIVVRTIALVPERGGWRATPAVIASLAAAVACVVAGVLLCGLPRHGWMVAAGAVPLVFVWLAVQDGAFLGDYVFSLRSIGIATVLVGTCVAIARAIGTTRAGVPHWAMAVGMVLGISVVKLAFFTHPQVTIGDGIFQVHRSAMVQHGEFFFTSVTPRPFFEFPYAIALFVAAMPFWDLFTQNVDHVWLLRTVTIVADALVGVAMCAVALRLWGRPRVALLIAGLWPFARAPLEALCNANLPNVFGQGVFGVAIAGLIWSQTSGRVAPIAFSLSTLALAVAFLSHFSTLSVGVPLVGAIGVGLFVAGGPLGRRQGLRIIAAGIIAALLAYAVYYRHFGEVYQATIDRVFSEEVVAQPGSAIAAPPSVKFQRWIRGSSDDYGLPGGALAIAATAGLLLLVRERRRDAFTISLVAWMLVWVCFTALGIVTAVQMRVNLAAAPVFVCLGAYGLAALSERGRAGRWLAAAAVMAVVWSGVSLWLMCIGR